MSYCSQLHVPAALKLIFSFIKSIYNILVETCNVLYVYIQEKFHCILVLTADLGPSLLVACVHAFCF